MWDTLLTDFVFYLNVSNFRAGSSMDGRAFDPSNLPVPLEGPLLPRWVGLADTECLFLMFFVDAALVARSPWFLPPLICFYRSKHRHTSSREDKKMKGERVREREECFLFLGQLISESDVQNLVKLWSVSNSGLTASVKCCKTLTYSQALITQDLSFEDFFLRFVFHFWRSLIL